ncbi:hypothetical protein GQ44DRAFT_737973 [Phaeosphaeriaceae sp. PMI808]|nr:hypothetical protein GQ44DRAFT_737973 [Phaeosphaeriaceae sp. PMI808]
MGADAGFDMVPRLSRGFVDRHNWDRFIGSIKELYKDDDMVEIKPNYIVFKAGEHPMLPFEGHKFLCFSAKITGSVTECVESYIDTVFEIARCHFGSRVRYWNELSDRYGEYGWNEIHESIRSYEQVDKPEKHSTIASLITGVDPIKELSIPLFEVKDIPGKGRGLVARFNISVGTRIICEKPLLERSIAAKLKALPKTSQREFLSLHNNYPGMKYPFSHTFKTNALPCGPDSAIGGVYPTMCLMNHSCIPNSQHSWDSKAKHETIYAVRPIEVGDEITICYDSGGTYDESFGFNCNCFGCSRPSAERQESDARYQMIQALDNAIGNPLRMQSSPEKSLEDCQSLLQLLEDEYDGYPGVLGARLYYDAFQSYLRRGGESRSTGNAITYAKARISSKLWPMLYEMEDKKREDTKRAGCGKFQKMAV